MYTLKISRLKVSCARVYVYTNVMQIDVFSFKCFVLVLPKICPGLAVVVLFLRVRKSIANSVLFLRRSYTDLQILLRTRLSLRDLRLVKIQDCSCRSLGTVRSILGYTILLAYQEAT